MWQSTSKRIAYGMKPAPTHLWNPTFCGEMDLVIRKDGVWVHEGSPIRRKELVNLFASILCIEDDGDYYLISPREKLKIKVDQYPFLVTEMKVTGNNRKQTISFKTNVGEQFEVKEHNTITIGSNKPECVPFVHIRNGLKARICRSVYYRFAELIVSEEEEIGVWSAGSFQTLSQL